MALGDKAASKSEGTETTRGGGLLHFLLLPFLIMHTPTTCMLHIFVIFMLMQIEPLQDR